MRIHLIEKLKRHLPVNRLGVLGSAALLAMCCSFAPLQPAQAVIIAYDDNSLPVGDNPQSFSASDCNEDGLPDIISADFDSKTATIFINDGNGALLHRKTISTSPQPSGAACADFTNDGIGDAAVGSWANGTVTINRGEADGSFTVVGTVPVGLQPRSVTTADLNDDSFPDLVVANAQSSDLTLLFGDGAGGFPAVGTVRLPTVKQTNRPRAAQVADFNKDGFPDIAVASQGDPSFRLLLGDGIGFTIFNGPLPTPGKLLGVAAGDLNDDQIPDVALLSTEAVLTLYTGVGNGTFTLVATLPLRSAAKAVAIADFSQDGFGDIAVSYSDANAVQVITALGPAQFPPCGTDGSPFLCPKAGEPVFNGFGFAGLRLGPDETMQMVFADKSRGALTLLEQSTLSATTPKILAALGGEPLGLILRDLNGDLIADAIVPTRAKRGVALQVFAGTADGGFVATGGASTCGDGILQGAELCDDGNTSSKDGCTTACVPQIDKSIVSMDAADVNADGHIDLIVADGKAALRVLYGDGQRRFKSVQTLAKLPAKAGAAVADFNGDGFIDIAAPPKRKRDGAIILYANDGLGNLVASTLPGPPLIGPLLAGDFDNNGFPDLLGVQTSKPKGLTLLSGDLTGPLRVVRPMGLASKSFQGLSAADFNEDGWLDVLIVGAKKQPTYALLGSPGGQLTPTAALTMDAMGTVTVTDVDQDQHQDIVACNQDKIGGCRVLYGSGYGGFGLLPFPAAPSVGREVRGAAAADLDGDGHVDIAGVSRRDDRLVIHFRGPVPQSIILPTGTNPTSLDLADFNDDGHMDLVAVNEGSQDISIFTNLGGRQFNTLARIKLPPGPSQPVSAAIADANDDRKPDIAVVQATSNHATLLLNTGAGFAALPTLTTGAEPRGVALARLNGDDLFDIVTANRAADSVSVFLSQPGGTFTRTDISSGGSKPWSIEAPDLNNDLFGDLVILNELSAVGSTEGSLVTYLNDQTGGFPVITEKHVRGREFPSQTCVGDFDGDGNADIAVASIYTGDVMLIHGSGTGLWSGNERSYALDDPISSVSCHDADGDDKTDIAFARRHAGDVGVILTNSQ